MSNRYEVAIRLAGLDGRPGIYTNEKPLLTRYQAKKRAKRMIRRRRVLGVAVVTAFVRRVQ